MAKKTSIQKVKKTVKKADKNTLLFEEISSCLGKGILELASDKIQNLGFDTSSGLLEVGNVKLEKKLFSNFFNIECIDDSKDIFGTSIENHEILWKNLCHGWEANHKFIRNTQLAQIGIVTNLNKIKVGNFSLEIGIGFNLNQFSINGGYSIYLIDKEKDIYGKWIDSSVNLSKIQYVLSLYTFLEDDLENADEVKWNKSLEEHFRTYFITAYKGEKNRNKLNLDLIVGGGSNEYGLELKIAQKLLVGAKSRDASGQLIEYSKDFGKKIVLVILGNRKTEQEPKISMLKEFVQEFGLSYYYMAATKSKSKKPSVKKIAKTSKI